ncbi:hypothetical protein K1T71_012780 [Dendrolimus kikuchii]|uniref:Uncharacterized protein n=1 Tax=Dendrolimus kikuchii TaxID=765133 RepID=A0ACC1CI15_9NEOP|nr:hypothetical protein K1T71_012780 [Dendrolimus kikuchii]
MEAELADLRRELASIRSELAEARAGSVRSAPPPPPEPTPPTTTAANLDRLILLMENRFAALEERIPPARPAPSPGPVRSPRPAPPRTTPPSPSLISGRLAEEFPPLPSRRVSTETAVSGPPNVACPAPPPPVATAAEGWTTVSRKKRAKNRAPPSSGTQPATTAAAAQPTSAPRRGGRGRGGKGQGDVAQAPASQPPPPPPPAPKKKTAAKEKRSPRLRPPKSAAVVLTLQPGAAERGVTYANLFSKAKSRIRLADLGIEGGLKLRQARTGGRILVLSLPRITSRGGEMHLRSGPQRSLLPLRPGWA